MKIRIFSAVSIAGLLWVGIVCGQKPADAPGANAPSPAAATEPAPAAGDCTLTIYSMADPAAFDPQQFTQQRANQYYGYQNKLPGYGLVRQTRDIQLNPGENTIRFADVASAIDPTTVGFKSLTDPETAVLEQNYEYDLLSADKLLHKYLDKPIRVTQAFGNGTPEASTGTLVSFDNTNLVLRRENGSVDVLPRGNGIAGITLLGNTDSGLITKPTLVWKVATKKGGMHTAQVTYQTDDLTWRADYNVTINKDDSAADIAAWVSILNESGAAYPNAHLKLVAGDVQRVRPQENGYEMQRAAAEKAIAADDTGFAEKSFFEYHLYTLGRTTSLTNNSTKQIELFPRKNAVPVEKIFVYYGLPQQMRYWVSPNPYMDQNLGTESNKKVDIYLQIANSEANGMGIPLPAGRIRVYKQDPADSNAEFIGEDVIQHTPRDEKVLVKLGSAFDIVGERKQTNFSANFNGHEIKESFEIKIRNHKTEAADVIIKENLFRWTNWEITACSDKWTKQDYRTIHIPVHVEAGAEKVVTYAVKYTW